MSQRSSRAMRSSAWAKSQQRPDARRVATNSDRDNSSRKHGSSASRLLLVAWWCYLQLHQHALLRLPPTHTPPTPQRLHGDTTASRFPQRHGQRQRFQQQCLLGTASASTSATTAAANKPHPPEAEANTAEPPQARASSPTTASCATANTFRRAAAAAPEGPSARSPWTRPHGAPQVEQTVAQEATQRLTIATTATTTEGHVEERPSRTRPRGTPQTEPTVAQEATQRLSTTDATTIEGHDEFPEILPQQHQRRSLVHHEREVPIERSSRAKANTSNTARPFAMKSAAVTTARCPQQQQFPQVKTRSYHHTMLQSFVVPLRAWKRPAAA